MIVRVFLRSGNHMDIECSEVEFTNDDQMNIMGYKFKDIKGNLHINVKQIEAWQTLFDDTDD